MRKNRATNSYHTLRQLFVSAKSAEPTRGLLRAGNLIMPCAIGRTGMRALKREGDGASPCGAWPLREAYYRADRFHLRPRTPLPLRALSPEDGWCDAAGDRNYNRLIQHPYYGNAERLWREDGLYDIVVVVGYNDLPRVKGRGSAIFIHVARTGADSLDLEPTEGCVALQKGHLLRLLPMLGSQTRLLIGI